MLHTQICVGVASFILFALLVILCIRCRPSKNVGKKTKHSGQPKHNKRLYSGGTNMDSSGPRDYSEHPRSTSSTPNDDADYINPVSAPYYNFDLVSSGYENVFTPKYQCIESDVVSDIYENSWLEEQREAGVYANKDGI